MAGTNLFLNTLYKWHDVTRPGCYVTWLEQSKELMTVCNKDDQKWYDTPSSDWIIEIPEIVGWSSADFVGDQYNGTIGFKNVAIKGYLDTDNFERNGMRYKMTLDTLERDDSSTRGILFTHGKFFFYNAGCHENSVRIANTWIAGNNMTYYLNDDPSDNKHRSSLSMTNGYRMDCGHSLVPAMKIDVNMYDFKFTRPPGDELAKHTSQKAMIDAYTINNNSPGTVSRAVKVSEKVKSEFSWGLSESLSLGSKVKGKAGIPLIAEGEVEASIDIEVGSNQDWTTSEEKSFEMSYNVNIPANTQVEISAWYDMIKGISMEYTATFEITGKTSRISVFNDIVPDTPATGLMIRNHLKYMNFDGEIVAIKDDRVIAKYKGTMTASVGVRGRLNVNGETVIRTM